MKCNARMGCLFAVLLACTLFADFVVAQEVEYDEASIERILAGNPNERKALSDFLKAKGSETPYHDMLRKWLRNYRGTSYDKEIADIAACLNDDSLFAAALERLEEQEAQWQRVYPPKETSRPGPDSTPRHIIGFLLEGLFSKARWAPVVPFIEQTLARPPATVSVKYNYLRFVISGECWLAVKAARALVAQKGEAALDLLKQKREAILSWVNNYLAEIERTGGYHWRDCHFFDREVHEFLLDYDKIIASTAWSTEKEKYVRMVQDSDPYKRYFALEIFGFQKDPGTVRYVVPLLDDHSEAWIPFSEASWKYFKTKGWTDTSQAHSMRNTLLGGDGSPGFCVADLRSAARNTLMAITGLKPVMSIDNTRVEFVPLGTFKCGDNRLLDEVRAWKDWWKANMHKLEYSE